MFHSALSSLCSFQVSWRRQKYHLSLYGLKILSGFGEFLHNTGLDKNNCVIKIITQCYNPNMLHVVSTGASKIFHGNNFLKEAKLFKQLVSRIMFSV